MKINYILLFLFLIFTPTFLSAFMIDKDTINIKKTEYQSFNLEKKEKIYIDFFAGTFKNKTFGLHPVVGARGGVRMNSKSSMYLASELRFGKSKNHYDFVIDDSLINTNHFLMWYTGIEYDRLLLSKNRYELISSASIGYDQISSPNINDKIHYRYGFAFNLGLGYLFKFKKGAGPQIKFIYHYANIKNKNGTHPNNNSFCIRLSYILGYKD